MAAKRNGHFVVIYLLIVTYTSLVDGFLPTSNNVVLEISAENFESCPEFQDLPNKLVNVSLWMDPEESQLYSSGVIIVEVPLSDSNDFKYSFNIKHCVRNDRRTCEKYLQFDIKDMCKQLSEKNKSWSEFVKKLEDFKPTCPVTPGTYKFIDAPIDTSGLKDVQVAVGYWQIETKISFQGKIIFCVVGDMTITHKRLSGRK